MSRCHVQAPTLLLASLLAALATGCDRAAAPAAPAAPATPAAVPASAPAPSPTAIANLRGEGIAGQLELKGSAGGVRITGTLTGVAPDSEHGFHLHDTGDCSAYATGSSGNDFDPGKQPHGGPDGAAHHAGDLPSLRADATGSLVVDVTVAGVGLATRDDHDVLGRALVLHQAADDYSTQPEGASGAPIACGVIELPPA